MGDTLAVYAFIGLMALNLLASFLYLVGLNQLKASARRAYQTYTAKPR